VIRISLWDSADQDSGIFFRNRRLIDRNLFLFTRRFGGIRIAVFSRSGDEGTCDNGYGHKTGLSVL